MTILYKVLGQINPTANTLTDCYTVPTGNTAVISTITVCNYGANTGLFSIAVRPAGATIANKHYISANTTVPTYDSIALTLGITLGNTDVISVSSSISTVSFNIFGSEIY